MEACGRRSALFVGERGMLLGNGTLLPEQKSADVKTLPRSPGHWVEWVNYAKGSGPVPGSNFQYSGRLMSGAAPGAFVARRLAQSRSIFLPVR